MMPGPRRTTSRGPLVAAIFLAGALGVACDKGAEPEAKPSPDRAVGAKPSPALPKPTPPKPPPPAKISVGIVVWPGFGPLYLAKERGYLDGVDVDIQVIENTEARRAALLAGRIDLEGITIDAIVIENAFGVPSSVIGMTDYSDGGDGVVAKAGIASLASLKGKTIAFAEGSPSHFFLLSLLDDIGLGSKDFKALPVDDAGQAGAVFSGGKVDAAVTWEPWLSKTVATKAGSVLTRSNDPKVEDMLVGVFAANRERLPAKREAVKRMLIGWYRAVRDWKQSPDKANETMAKAMGIPVQEFADILSGAHITTYAEARGFFGLDAPPGKLAKVVAKANKVWQAAGVTKKPVDVKAIVDGTLLAEIASEVPK